MAAFFIITAGQDAGKTSFILEAEEILRKGRYPVFGFAAPGEYTPSGEKQYYLRIFDTEQKLPFISLTEQENWTKWKRFWIKPVALEAGYKTLGRFPADERGFVIMDELGPLELEEKGWHSCLLQAQAIPGALIILSVRERMLERLITHYKIDSPVIIKVSEVSAGIAADAFTNAMNALGFTK